MERVPTLDSLLTNKLDINFYLWFVGEFVCFLFSWHLLSLTSFNRSEITATPEHVLV